MLVVGTCMWPPGSSKIMGANDVGAIERYASDHGSVRGRGAY